MGKPSQLVEEVVKIFPYKKYYSCIKNSSNIIIEIKSLIEIKWLSIRFYHYCTALTTVYAFFMNYQFSNLVVAQNDILS